MDAATGIVVLLVLGLALRLIIAYLIPGSGFAVDLASFQYWASNLGNDGLHGFYERDFFHDYTPGYLYVLWLVGGVANLFGGGVGDLIKLPPIVADLALGYLVWSMVRELGGSERSARIGAALVLFNPVTWFDSVVWGQVDSFGVVFLLLALRELWRDRPERSAILATVAALIKPQLGILIPIVAIVVIRRALWPTGGYGLEDRPEAGAGTTSWEERVRGPIRIVTAGAAALLTAFLACLPFGLSFPFGLIAQIFKTAGGYPYLSVNAFNPWAVLVHRTADGIEQSIALTRTWVCDSTIVPTGPSEFRIGPIVIPELGSPGSDLSCPDGAMLGAFPAVLVGAVLFLVAAIVVCWIVARRPDRLTMTVGLAALALAFFVLPTRVHERYLFPLAAIAAIPAAASIRWRIGYVLSALATFANMYVVLAVYYPDNPQISDWLGLGDEMAAPWGVAIAAAVQAAILAWVLFQLREGAVEGLAHDLATAGHRDEPDEADAWDLVDRPVPDGGIPPDAEPPPPAARRPLGWAQESPAASTFGPGDAAVLPAWTAPQEAPALGPIAWFRARLADTPVRADRSRELDRERGGRMDRLDLWFLALLAISLLTVRMWRLDEPYQMHFDEVYHPRTATEFLQDWRYGLPHNIYEWTHPHLAKYAMALGIVAFGEDEVTATGQLGAAVTAADIERRRDDGLDETRIQGDRLWVATGSEVRGYDLGTRELTALAAIPDAVAVAYDEVSRQLFVGTRGGEIDVIDTEQLEPAPAGVSQVDWSLYASVDAGLDRLFLSRNGERLLAIMHAGTGTDDPTATPVVVLDAPAAAEIGRIELPGVAQVTDSLDDRIFAATDQGLAVIDPDSVQVTEILDVDGPARGVVGISDIENDPIYVSVQTPEGPRVKTISTKDKADPSVDQTFTLPGATAGEAFFDVTTRTVHVEGTTPDEAGGLGDGAPPGQPTLYVIEPHANAVYADARLPFSPAAIVLDENQQYPSTDREQLLALDAGGRIASVPIGRHAFAWRLPGVVAGVLMAVLLYVLARLLFRRRTVAVILGLVVLVDGMLFVQSRIGMNDSYVGLGIIGAYTVFAALWLHPGESRRHWLAFAIGIPIIGFFLGFALAAKWVAAFAIGGLGLLVLSRSALGRLLLIGGLILLTTVLGYIAISVPEGGTGVGNYLFFGIMIALLLIAVIANVVHPIAWSWDETRFAVGAPAAVGLLVILYGLTRGDAAGPMTLGPVSVTPIELGMLGIGLGVAVWGGFLLAGRLGFGPLAPQPEPADPMAVLEPAAAPARGWLRLGAGFGLPAVWLAVGLLVIPIGLYVVSYLPWAFVDNYQIVQGWPPGHDNGQTLLDLTGAMYSYHNNLPNPHPASSPWWAWALDLKPVWFYEQGFAGSTSASIYDAGNLVAWWLAIPAMAFVAWQAFRRRSPALALIAIAFACQWISWARIDRAAFQYHYYTALPFLFLALAYFLAELWHGTSRRIWLLARLSAGAAVLGPFVLWLLHRPLCAIVRVEEVVPGSQACPTLIPDVTVTPRAVALAVVMGIGVLLLLRELLAVTEEDEPGELEDEREAGGWRGALARIGLGGRWATSAAIAVVTAVAFLVFNATLGDVEGFQIEGIPVEPIALVVLLALSPVAAYVATARDSRRFVAGALGAMAFWFVLWYPNLAALPLPVDIHNAYQGFLPTYLYPFQFAVSNSGASAPALFAIGPAIMLVSLLFMSVVVAYSAWSWRVALAERRRDRLAAQPEPPPWAARAE
ncbi:MAG TPA: phospholipid carrier-dependent glycosyltransferase [Candidatus Limnocylindrales bacterium]|nr:phospholipid carrier-dependent glycosyltransferase [Candidatus Limnocylindrales bacterium]